MDLKQFYFPVQTVQNYHEILGSCAVQSNQFKTIVDGRTNEAISVVKPTYKLIENKELIERALETLAKTDVRYEVDNTHSFVQPNRMKLKLNLPDFPIKDDTNEGLALSLHIHNSYDMSEGARLLFGAIRWICTNGAVFGEVLGKWYSKHTMGFSIENLGRYMDETYKKIPEINQRIEILQNMEDADTINNLLKTTETKLGKNIKEYVENEITALTSIDRTVNAWALYNLLTRYATHAIQAHQRARYESEISKIFKL